MPLMQLCLSCCEMSFDMCDTEMIMQDVLLFHFACT